MAETGIEFPLVEADAGGTGLPDASADLVVSEYGASIWVDPYRRIPEASRLLRPNGRLVFMRNSTLVMLCSADDERVGTELTRPLELLAPADPTDHEFYDYVPAAWAKQWPAEEIWTARKTH
jgi:ubiquinone/menaquinone biosynthesis C-methylase UbiE